MPEQYAIEPALAQRLAAIEKRLDVLEAATDPKIFNAAINSGDSTSDVQGNLQFSGNISLPIGDATYTWMQSADSLSETIWEQSIERIAAIAHPVRAQILQHLLRRKATAADLVSAKIATSAGTAYHHLSALQAAGWVEKRHGTFAIPAARIIPLLCLITCGQDH